MTKTTAPRVRQTNLYTVESDGQPVAQAMAISQAEAVRLYVESVQQPTMTARLSSPLEARTLAGLPLLTRGEAVRDEATPDLFDGVPVAPVSPVVGAVVGVECVPPADSCRDPVLLATYCPPVELPVKTYPPAVLAQIVAELAPDHLEDVREMGPPQHAPIAAVLEDLASGEPMPSALSTAAPTASPAHAEAEAPPAYADAPTVWLDDAALTARKSDAFHAGLELGKRGLKRFSAEMLTVDVEMLRGVRGRVDADAVHCELLRGFEDGRASIGAQSVAEEPKGAGRPVAKYRNPDDGSTWSGRGLKPRWLVAAQETGRTMDEFLL